MTLDATKNFAAPLTRERLFAWQAALFPIGRSGLREITVGGWRDDAHGPMQVVSGAVGHQRIHDGNGRIARALADMSLARSENSPNRFYSLSSQIRRDRPEYYGSLEHTEKGALKVLRGHRTARPKRPGGPGPTHPQRRREQEHELHCRRVMVNLSS